MKLKSKAMVILLIFLMILVIPTSFASDTDASIADIENAGDLAITFDDQDINSGNISSVNDDSLITDSGTLSATHVVQGGNAQKIIDAINNASIGDTIYLYGDFIGDKSIKIDKPINLVGLNCVIDGQHNVISTFLDVQSKYVNITGITFKNFGDKSKGNAGKSCTIRIGNGQTNYNQSQYCTIDDCTFINSFANDGQVTFYSKNSRIINSRFYNNTGFDDGGAIDINIGFTTVENCTFINNTAGMNRDMRYACGGAISCADNDPEKNGLRECKILNCYFENCTTTNNAGAIRFGSTDGVIDNCTFYKCSAPAEGGAIYVLAEKLETWGGGSFDNMTITNIKCYECNAQNGSAIYVLGNNTKIDTSKIYNNTEINGAIYIKGSNSTLEDIEIHDNTANKLGGAIYVIGENSFINNLTLYNNTAINGGAVYIKGKNATFENVYAYENNATENGGAIYVAGEDASFENVTTSRNKAVEGGAIYVDGPNADFYQVGIYRNSAENGGAIYVAGNTANFENVTGSYNNATGYGGAIYVSGVDTVFDSLNLTYNNAFAGGAVAVIGEVNSKNEAIQFIDGYINNNTAYAGGAIFINASYTVFKDMDYYDNVANFGGAAVIIGNNTNIEYSDFIRNRAIPTNQSTQYGIDGLGGAIIIHGYNVTIHNDTIFDMNRARNGSAIYMFGSGQIENASFRQNQAWVYELHIGINPSGSIIYNTTNQTEVSILLIGGNNIANAIYNANPTTHIIDGKVYEDSIEFINVTYGFYINGEEVNHTTGDNEHWAIIGAEQSQQGTILYQDDRENNQNVTIIIAAIDEQGNYEIIFNSTNASHQIRTDIYGNISYTINKTLEPGLYAFSAVHEEDNYYTSTYNYTAMQVIPITDLVLNKTGEINNGVVYWNVTITNYGPQNDTEVYVNESTFKGKIFDVTPSKGSFDEKTMIWTVGHLDVGEIATLTFKSNLDLGNGSFDTNSLKNYAIVKGLGNDTNLSNNYDEVELDWNITKTVSDVNPNYNDTVTYTLNVTNTGNGTAKNVTVNDNVPEGLVVDQTSLIDTENYKVTFDEINNIITWTIYELESGNSITMAYNVTVQDYGYLTNNATVYHKKANKTIAVPDVDIKNKTTPIDNPNYGDNITYTINIVNNGDVNATNAVIIDYLPEGLEVVESSLAPSGGLYNWDSRTIVWTVNLTAGEERSFVYNVTVLAYGNLTNNVTSGNHTKNKTINVPQIIIVNKTTTKDEFDFGEIVEYTVNIQNNGTGPADNVVVKDILPEGLVLNESTMDPMGTYDEATRTITWIVDLTVGEIKTFTYNCTTNKTGNLTNEVIVGNETANKTIYVKSCDVAINITAPEKVKVGEEFDITVVVTNYGPDAAENTTATFNFTGVEVSILNVNTTNGTNYTNGTWTIGTLPVGENVTLVFHVKATQTGTLVVTGVVTTTTYDNDLSNNVDNATVIIEEIPSNNISMLSTGNPLVVLLFALLVVPFVRRFNK